MDNRQKLTTLLNSRNHSDNDLAELSGVPQSTISRFRNGTHKNLRQEKWEQITAVYGLSYAQFLAWDGVLNRNTNSALAIHDNGFADGEEPGQRAEKNWVEENAEFTLDEDSNLMRYVREAGGIISNEYRIPLLSQVGSMGSGEHLTYEGDQIIQFMPISASWIQSTLKIKPENLRVITGAGDSMKPTFSHGDLLLVDISSKEIKIDGIYAMSAYKRLFIKRVRQRMDGSFEVSSDNPTVKTVDILNGDHEVTVHGRVVWAWNGSNL